MAAPVHVLWEQEQSRQAHSSDCIGNQRQQTKAPSWVPFTHELRDDVVGGDCEGAEEAARKAQDVGQSPVKAAHAIALQQAAPSIREPL